jgi:hypothetical protein
LIWLILIILCCRVWNLLIIVLFLIIFLETVIILFELILSVGWRIIVVVSIIKPILFNQIFLIIYLRLFPFDCQLKELFLFVIQIFFQSFYQFFHRFFCLHQIVLLFLEFYKNFVFLLNFIHDTVKLKVFWFHIDELIRNLYIFQF